MRNLHIFLASFIFLLITGNVATSHPHVFITPKLKAFIAKNKLKKVQLEWHFDLMTSSQVLAVVDKNKNKKLDRSEVNFIRKQLFPGLAQFNYYLFIKTNSKPYQKPFSPKKFKARLTRRKKLIYSFELPINKTFSKTLELTFNDSSMYVTFSVKAPQFKIVGSKSNYKLSVKNSTVYIKTR